MIDVSNPLYKSVIEPIIQQIMDANEVGREYAERFVIDTVHNTLADYGLSYDAVQDTVDEAVRDMEYRIEANVEAMEQEIFFLQAEIASLTDRLDAMEDKASGNWLTRLFR